MGIAVDSAGNAYVAGETHSSDFPTTIPDIWVPGVSNGFVSKVDCTKSGAESLIYSTVLGGSNDDSVRGVAVDAQGNAYVTGETNSPNFPIVNAVQPIDHGVFQTTDGGNTWTTLSVSELITALAIDTTTSPRTLYAGSGCCGVLKSIDGGRNWGPINIGLPEIDERIRVKALAVSPADPSTLYVSTNGGIFKIVDGGASWTDFNAGIASGDFAAFLAFDTRTSPATLYAGSQSGLYKVSDGGSSWSLTAHPAPLEGGWSFDRFVWFMAMDPHTSPSTLYTLDSSLTVRKSVDGGNTWAEIRVGPDSDFWFFFGIDPATTPATLYGLFGYGSVWRSTDGGNSWEDLGSPPYSFYDFGAITADTTTVPSTLYLRSLSGYNTFLLRSTDRGYTWTPSFLPEYSTNGIGAIAIDTAAATAGSPSPVYVGTLGDRNDAFVSKVNASGSALLFSTGLGGLKEDRGRAIALDSSGNIYVAGAAGSTFPTVHAFQSTAIEGGNPTAAFVVKLGDAALPSSSTGPAATQMVVPTGTLELTLPNVTGSTTGAAPTVAVNPLDDAATANLQLSNNLGAYEISTTATYDTSGYNSDPTLGIKIAFTVPTVNDEAIFDGLVITHGEDQNGDHVIQPEEMVRYDGSVSPSKVTYHDFATRTVWVYVPSLSPFVIVKSPIAQQILWSNPAPIIHGTALGTAQLNATVLGPAGGLPTGALTYTPAAGTVLGPGHNTLRVDAAATADYRAALATVTLDVRYDWSGVLQPINADGSSVFKLGRTVPVKFQLANASAGLTNAVATFSYRKISNTAGSVNESDPVVTPTSGNQFRYDPTAHQYIYNWSTQGLTSGTYELRIDMGDGLIRTVRIALR
jgi:photosystem II stability/assembly factor-like uncharacterized protein